MEELNEDLELILETKAHGIHPAIKYRSRKTGLEVIHVDVGSGPVIQTEIVVATPPEHDCSEISALKELIFCGSEDYPYNGVLKYLSNKYFCPAPYGFSIHDHTRYLLRTVGAGAFSVLLPVYLDHIFYPLLSDAAFATEIHHVDGEGEDGGKLYLETVEDNPVCGWAEAMGTLFLLDGPGFTFENLHSKATKLRDVCTISKVRDYHRKYYNPKNICVIIAGRLGQEELFQALGPIVRKLVLRDSVPLTWARPWLKELVERCDAEETVIFPTDDSTDRPLIIVRFNGLSALRDLEEVQALRFLIEYLSVDFRVRTSPLTRVFVEESKLISGGVFYCDLGSNRANITLDFLDVDLENCDLIAPRLRQALLEEIEDFDLERMNRIIMKIYDSELSSVESLPEHYDSVVETCLEHFLYSKDLDDTAELERRLNPLRIIKSLQDRPSSFWTERIQTMLLQRTWTIIKTIPSKDLLDKFKAEEENKLQERKARLSVEDLQKLGLDLENSKAEMSRPIPMNIICDSKREPTAIKLEEFHSVRRLDSEKVAGKIPLKYSVYFDDIQSSFASISVVLDTSSLEIENRKYLPLFCNLLTSTDILMDDKELVSYQRVQKEIQMDFVEHSCFVGLEEFEWGISGLHSHLLRFYAKVKIENLGTAFAWLKKLFWQTQFAVERILEAAEDRLKDLKSSQDNVYGGSAESILKSHLYNARSNIEQMSRKVQEDFLDSIVSGKLDPSIQSLETIRNLMHDPEKAVLHVAANFSKVKELYNDQIADGLLPETWMEIFSDKRQHSSKEIPDTAWIRKKPLSPIPPLQLILPKKTEKAFLSQVTPSITDPNHPDIPAILTAIQYLTEDEGPFPQNLSAKELGYIRLNLQVPEGMLFLNLQWSPDLAQAYRICKEVIQDLLTGQIQWEPDILAAAKGTLILNIVEASSNPLEAAEKSFNSHLLGLPPDYNQNLLSQIPQVSLTDIKEATSNWLQHIFPPSYSVIISPEGQVSSLIQGFSPLGISPMLPTEEPTCTS